MTLGDTIKKAEESRPFRDWHGKNPDFYLAHAFTMLDEKEQKYRWELGYYSSSKDRLVVVATEPEVKVGEEEEVFKKDGQVSKLDMGLVKIPVLKAMEICNRVLKEHYSSQVVTKRIILVQNQPRHIYNVTLVTHTFSILNVKIDASTGEVLGHKLQSIMNLGKWEKGELHK